MKRLIPARGQFDADDYGLSAMAFVEKVGSLTSPEAIFGAFEAAMADVGFEFFIMVDLPKNNPTSVPKVLLSKAPIGWTDHYIRNGYQTCDPVFDQCRQGSQPFEWKEIIPPANKRDRAQAVMRRARDFGLVEGLTIPIHNFDGTSSCVSMGAADPYINRFTKPAIHLMAIYAFDQVRQLTAEIRSGPRLTDREVEVLTWAAAGKSALSIAGILNISERTAVAHTVNATQKLGASNKTHAVAIALRRRLINI